MKATDLFPSKAERDDVKRVLDLFRGEVTKVVDGKKIIYQNEKAFVKKPVIRHL